MEHHTDLTTIGSQGVDDQLKNQPYRNDKAWIGLSKDGIDNWKWVGGENVTFSRWKRSTYDINKNCVEHRADGWHDNPCSGKHHFFCSYHNLVLVKENKTWEEAMELCRDQKKDLVTLPSAYALSETLAISQGAQTDLVWTGLRYLADRWLWVSGETRNHVDAPQCPGWSHHCGALSLTENNVVAWDCVVKTLDRRRDFHRTEPRLQLNMEKSAPVCLILTCFFTVALCQFNMYIAEEKTWQAARNYCMEHHTDLTSIRSQEEDDQLKDQPSRNDKAWIGLSKDGIDNWKWGAQIEFVWTGLRYLADRWLWVSGENKSYWDWNHPDVTQCPGWSHRCGALSLKGNYVVAWDCADKLNFVCAKKNIF
ncbi:hypothetical protein EYF80_038256 [Liparis tanakae]|uniref:C-type lectin domain-containing protein n=1 Tax=Liparis tanakae TaxID=230148 RepID=A0A4Z2GED6_9TELE|nr:hypothetical protein EYF80_038256 [Liparis tanakae]